MPLKIKWTVSLAPTGRFKSFDHRAWPSAEHVDEKQSACAQIRCEDEYRPADVKTGRHAELVVSIADHSSSSGSFQWRTLKKRFATLDKAKQGAADFLERNPEYLPEGVRDALDAQAAKATKAAQAGRKAAKPKPAARPA